MIPLRPFRVLEQLLAVTDQVRKIGTSLYLFWSLARPTPVVHLGLSRVRTYICVFPSEKEAWKFYHLLIIMTRVLLFCSLKPATSYLHSAKGVGERWKKGGQKGLWSEFEGSLVPPSQLKIPSWMVLGWDTERNILQIHPSCPFWKGCPCFYSFQLTLQCFVAYYLSNLDHVWSKEPWHL